MQQLRVVSAPDNYLRSVHLQLSHLEELDVRNNFIDTIPFLSSMPKLKTIYLNANNIREARLVTNVSNYNHLVRLSIRNNKIAFEEDEKGRGLLDKFLSKLGRFRALRVVNLDHNPYEKDPEIVR